MDYAIQYYLNPDRIEDAIIRAAWEKAKQALADLMDLLPELSEEEVYN